MIPIGILVIATAIWFGYSNARALSLQKRLVFSFACMLPASAFLIAAKIHFGIFALVWLGVGLLAIVGVAYLGRFIGVRDG